MRICRAAKNFPMKRSLHVPYPRNGHKNCRRLFWCVCLVYSALPLFPQGVLIGPYLEAGVMRTFDRTGIGASDEVKPAGGIGGLAVFQGAYVASDFAADGTAWSVGLSVGGRFYERFGLGIKGAFLHDSFLTVLSDDQGNPLPPLDNSRTTFLLGGQFLFFPGNSIPEKGRGLIVHAGGVGGSGLWWIHAGVGWVWSLKKKN